MSPARPLLLLALLALGAFGGARAVQDKGVVYLGDETFDKVLGAGRLAAVVSVDREYPYGAKHDAFKKAAALIADAGPSARALVAVGVPVSLGRPGLEVNARLAARFGVKAGGAGGAGGKGEEPEDLPKIFFVPAGGAPEDDAVAYEGDREDGDAIAKWAAERAGVFVGLRGQIRELEEAGHALLRAADGAEAERLLEEAKRVANGLDKELKEEAEYYVKSLTRIVEKGVVAAKKGAPSKGREWLGAEEARLRRVAADAAVAENKRETMRWRANILGGLLREEGGGADGEKKKTEL